jgi:hypothetical protein
MLRTAPGSDPFIKAQPRSSCPGQDMTEFVGDGVDAGIAVADARALVDPGSHIVAFAPYPTVASAWSTQRLWV